MVPRGGLTDAQTFPDLRSSREPYQEHEHEHATTEERKGQRNECHSVTLSQVLRLVLNKSPEHRLNFTAHR